MATTTTGYQSPYGPYITGYQYPGATTTGYQSTGYQYPWQQKMGQSMGTYSTGGTAPGGFTSGTGAVIPNPGQSAWYSAMQSANQQSQSAAQDALAKLSTSFSQGPFGQGLANMFQAPRGMDEATFQQMLRMLRDREAGSRASVLEGLQGAAASRGMQGSGMLMDAMARARANSASALNDAEINAYIQREMMKQAQQGMAGGLLGQLYGLDARLLEAYANAQMGRQFPILPQQGGSTGWSGWTLPSM